MYRVDTNCEIIPDYSYFSDKDNEFILIEEEPDIDIQSINELLIDQLTEREHTNADIFMLGKQINVLTIAIKQLDRQIKEDK